MKLGCWLGFRQEKHRVDMSLWFFVGSKGAFFVQEKWVVGKVDWVGTKDTPVIGFQANKIELCATRSNFVLNYK